MKNIVKFVAVVTFAILAFTSCNNNKENEEENLATAVIGRWKAIKYDGITLPSTYIMTMTIGADGSFEQYTYIPGEDGEEAEESSLQGTWRLDGNAFYVIVNNYDYGTFNISSISNNKMNTYIEESTTTWSKL